MESIGPGESNMLMEIGARERERGARCSIVSSQDASCNEADDRPSGAPSEPSAGRHAHDTVSLPLKARPPVCSRAPLTESAGKQACRAAR